jgi:hypothetical protein
MRSLERSRPLLRRDGPAHPSSVTAVLGRSCQPLLRFTAVLGACSSTRDYLHAMAQQQPAANSSISFARWLHMVDFHDGQRGGVKV